MTINLKNMTRVVSWVMAFGLALTFALPAEAIEFFPTPFRFQWSSQSGALSADGTAHEHYINAGESANMSLSVTNRSTDQRALVMYGIPPGGNLLPEVAPYRGAHELRIGVKNDEILPWLDTSSFIENLDGDNNRLSVYDGPNVHPGSDVTFNWPITIASDAADGVYEMRVSMVREFDAWATNIDGGDIFWRIIVGEGTVAVGGGDLNIGISGNTPAEANVAELSADIPMAMVSFTAGASDNALITGISIRKTGLSADTDVSDLKLYDGATKLGSTQGVNSTSHKATFTGLSWLVPAGTTKTLTIKGTIPSAASVGDIIVVGVQSAADITLSGGGSVTGTFPAYGNEFTVGSTSVGYLGVTAPSTPAANTGMISGSTDQDLASFKFTASSTEGFDVNSITLTEIGTSVDTDVLNMKLMYVGDQVGSTQASLSNGEVTFTGSPLFSIIAGTSKTIYVTGDVASGITSARTIRFEINDTPDVIAYGQNSNGIVTIDADAAGTVYAVAQGSTMTIAQGTLSITISPTNLSAQTYVVGEEQAELSKFKFSAGTNEGVKITKLIFNEDLLAVTTDYQNARLYIDDSTTPIATGGSISTTTITFEDGNGLFEIAKSGNTEVTLKVDISTAADGATPATFRFGIGADDNAYTNIVMYGIVSNEKIDSDATHITAMTAVDDGDMNTHTLAAKGTLVVSNGPNTPALSNFALGTDDFEFHQFRMQAVSEAARVTGLTVRFYDDTATGADDSGNGATTGDVNNAQLFVWDGAAWVLLDEVGNPSTGVATFGFDYTIAKNTTDVFKVVADIPTGASLTNLFTGVAGTGDGYNIYDEVTASGVASGATYGSGDTSGLSDSNVFTKVAPIITVNASTVPGARTIIVNGNDILLGKFFLSANDVEDIKISTLKVYTDIDGTMDGASAAELLTSTTYLRFDDGGTWRTTNTDNWATGSPDFITFSGSDFNDPNEWIVPKGGSLVIEIRADVLSAGTAYVGMTIADTNVVGAGLSSGTSATIYDSANNAYDAIWASPALTLSAGGTLTVTAATDTPTTQMVTTTWDSENPQTPTFFRMKLAGTSEELSVDALRAKIADVGNATEDDNFAGTVYVYSGGTMANNVLTGGTLVGSGDLIPVDSAEAAADIVFTTPVIVPVDGNSYITLMAELTSTTAGADSGDVPYLGLDYDVQTGLWDSTYADDYNIRTTGVQSNALVYSAGAPSAILKGSAAYVVKTKLGVAVNSASPSGTATRQADHTIMKLNLTNTSVNTDARFRAGAHNAMTELTTDFTGSITTDGIWTDASNGTFAASSAAYVEGGASLLITAGADTNPIPLYTFAGDTDLSEYTGVGFWYMTDDAATNVMTVSFGQGTGTATVNPGTNDQWEFALINFADESIAGINDASTFQISMAAGAGDLTYFDGVVLYKDFMQMNVTANVGLWDGTGATTSPVVNLKDASSGTTLVSGYLAGTVATTFVGTSQATVYWFPTTEMAIPASGKTYNVSTDTTVFMTATSRDLTMSIGLGSADSAGAITAGNVRWNDNSADTVATVIGWVDSNDSPLVRSLNF